VQRRERASFYLFGPSGKVLEQPGGTRKERARILRGESIQSHTKRHGANELCLEWAGHISGEKKEESQDPLKREDMENKIAPKNN